MRLMGSNPVPSLGLHPRKSLVNRVPHPALTRTRRPGVHLLRSSKSAALRKSAAVRPKSGHHHGNLMGVGSNRFQIVLVGEESIRGSNETVAQICGHSDDHIFLPQETMAAARAEIRDAEIWHAAQALNLAPQLGL